MTEGIILQTRSETEGKVSHSRYYALISLEMQRETWKCEIKIKKFRNLNRKISYIYLLTFLRLQSITFSAIDNLYSWKYINIDKQINYPCPLCSLQRSNESKINV